MERVTTLKHRNQLLNWADEDEFTALVFEQGGYPTPDPSKASPNHAARMRARAAEKRARAATFRPVIEGEES